MTFSDGRADYIWVHPLDGSVEAWRNLAADTPSSINWVPYTGSIAAGVDFSGANIKFAYLNHPRTGRADVSGSFSILMKLHLCGRSSWLAPHLQSHRLLIY